jgi:excisionase family DNA binding protein
VHQKTTLGIGGRRVLVSRDWSGKTLADHRADAHAWVKALLGTSTHADQTRRPPTTSRAPARSPGRWPARRPRLPPLEHRLLRAISQRIQQRAQLAAAQQRASGDPPADVSATDRDPLVGEESRNGRRRSLDTDEVAALLRATPRFVRRLVAERRITYVKVGRKVLFERSAIAAYVAAHRVTPLSRADLRPRFGRVA